MLLIVLGLLIAGCATTMDSKTPPTDISGRWEGTWRRSPRGLGGALTLNLTQNGTEVAGSLDSEIESLSVTGMVSGNTFRFVSPGTSLNGTFTVQDTQMTGVYLNPRNQYWYEVQLTRKKS
jgi:hypothetical protein